MKYLGRELHVDDILTNLAGRYEYKCLEVLTNTVLLSSRDDFTKASTWMTAEQMEGWELTFKNKEQWRPEEGRHYWYKNISGNCHCATYSTLSKYDRYFISIGNCFRTEAECEAAEVYLPAKKS